MPEAEIIEKIDTLVLELGCDYDRLSTSGQRTYAELCSAVNQLVMEGNHEDQEDQEV